MGGREVGGMANLLSAHRDLANPAAPRRSGRAVGRGRVPSQPGKTAVEMFQAAADGEIKALWIACTNPAQSCRRARRGPIGRSSSISRGGWKAAFPPFALSLSKGGLRLRSARTE
jgi:hypothetical protein